MRPTEKIGMETLDTASCVSQLSWNTRISRTRLTTVDGLSLSASPDVIVQSLDDVLQNVRRLGLQRCEYDDMEFEEQVGEGESFQVERCRYNKKLVAVKHIKLGTLGADKLEFSRRLRTVLTELLIMHHKPLREHPNLLSVLGYGWKTHGRSLLPYIVVEYCEHGSLRSWLQQSSHSKSIKTKLILVGDITAGLTALHLCDIIHGDLKLDNIVVLPSWDRPANAIAKLCDFGHSIILGDNSKNVKYYGTPLYNAPEVLLQDTYALEPTSFQKCDIWAFGLLVWEIFADGKKYFNRAWEKDSRFTSQAPIRKLLAPKLDVSSGSRSIAPSYLTGTTLYESKSQNGSELEVSRTESRHGRKLGAICNIFGRLCSNKKSTEQLFSPTNQTGTQVPPSEFVSIRKLLDHPPDRAGSQTSPKGPNKVDFQKGEVDLGISDTRDDDRGRTSDYPEPLSDGGKAPQQNDLPSVPEDTLASQSTFGLFDQKHLRYLGRTFIRSLKFPEFNIEKGYLLKLLDRSLEVDPSKRISQITRLPLMTHWNRSDISSLQDKLALHTGSSALSFKMFYPDQDREIRWEHQQQILEDFERIALHHKFKEEAGQAAFQVSICYMVGFGTSPDLDKTTSFLSRAEELQHPMAKLFGENLKSVTSKGTSVSHTSYDVLVMKGFKVQRTLSKPIFELHGSKDARDSNNILRFNTYADLQGWLEQFSGQALTNHVASRIVTIPPTFNMNIFECFIAMEDVDNVHRLAGAAREFSTTVFGEPLLVQACRTGNAKLVQALVEAGVEEIPSHDPTLYHFLFMLGKEVKSIVKLLKASKGPAVKDLLDCSCYTPSILHLQWPLELKGTPLAYAIFCKSLDGVAALLELGANPIAPVYRNSDVDGHQVTPLHLAAKYHLHEILQLLVAEVLRRVLKTPAALPKEIAAIPTQTNRSQAQFPFAPTFQAELACSLAYSTPVERFAMHGAGHRQALLDTITSMPLEALGWPRKNGRTALFQAIDFSDLPLVEAILRLVPGLASKPVFDPKDPDVYDLPVSFACQIGAQRESSVALDIVKRLIEVSPESLRKKDSQGRTPLHLAVTGFSDSITQWLLSKGASVRDVDCSLRAPLHYASSATNVNTLLNANAEVNRVDLEGFTALHVACLSGSEEVVRALIARKADLTLGNNPCGTPLHCAVSKRSRGVVSALLEQNVLNGQRPILDINACSGVYGHTPLHLAAQTSRTDIVKLLFANRANGSLQNKETLTPLHLCVISADATFLKSFIAAAGHRCSPINEPDFWGLAPLHHAAMYANPEAVKVLLSYGAKVALKDIDGNTPLHLAAGAKNQDLNRTDGGDRLLTCKMLLENGATLRVKNKKGLTPWDIASAGTDLDLAEYLKVYQERTSTSTVPPTDEVRTYRETRMIDRSSMDLLFSR